MIHARFNEEQDSIISFWLQRAFAQRIAYQYLWPVGVPSLPRATTLLEPFAGRGLSSVRQELSWQSTFIYQNSGGVRIIVQLPAIYQRLVVTKVFYAVRKASQRESIESAPSI